MPKQVFGDRVREILDAKRVKESVQLPDFGWVVGKVEVDTRMQLDIQYGKKESAGLLDDRALRFYVIAKSLEILNEETGKKPYSYSDNQRGDTGVHHAIEHARGLLREPMYRAKLAESSMEDIINKIDGFIESALQEQKSRNTESLAL